MPAGQTPTQGTGAQDSEFPGLVQAARSGNYTVSAAEVAQGWTNPIELLWPIPFADANYTVSFNVEQILGINAPKLIAQPGQFQRMQDTSGAGGGRSQGVMLVIGLPANSKAGDILVAHCIGIHDGF